VFIRGEVFPDGKENFLAAVHRAGRCDGRHPAVTVVESGAHLPAAGLLLVGGLSQRMDLVEILRSLSPFINCIESKYRGTLIAILPLFLHESAYDSPNFSLPYCSRLQYCRAS
jgi:hypothetical protein